MSVYFINFLVLYIGLPIVIMAQSVEVCQVKPTPGTYIRFDRFTVNCRPFKLATHKGLQLQDSQGYLWFISEQGGTHQLIRYDGTYSKLFGHSHSRYSGSNDGGDGLEVGLVKEDQDRQIWVATQEGLSRFDPKTETFRVFRNPYVKQQTIDYWVMGKGSQQWFTTRELPDTNRIRSFFVFDSRSVRIRKIHPAKLVNGYTNQIESTQPISFRPKAVDKAGRVWGDVNSGTPALGYYDPLTNALVWYPLGGHLLEKSVTTNEKLYNIGIVRPEGNFVWIGSFSGVGLLRFNVETKNWKQYYFSNALNRVYQIVPRNNYQFWLQTDSSLSYFDKRTEKLYTCLGESGYDHHFPYVAGQNRTLWRGLYQGTGNATLKVVHETQQPFMYKGDSLAAFGLLYKNKHQLYISYRIPDKHLIFAQFNDSSYKTTLLYRWPLTSYFEQNIWFALRDSTNQTLWLIGKTAQGSLFTFNERTRQLKPIQATIHGLPPGENQISDYDDIRLIAQDQKGNIWFPVYGDRHGGNLFRFDRQLRQFIGFKAGTHGLPAGHIRCLTVDPHGYIWLGYREGVVYRFNPVTNQATPMVKSIHGEQMGVTGLVADPIRQKVWIARSKAGIWEYDQRSQIARRISREEAYGQDFFGLTFHLTKTGRLWFKNDGGLIQLDPQSGRINRFGVEYDLHNFFNLRLDKSDDDEFFYGGFRFYDHNIRSYTNPPKVVFSFLKVFDKAYPMPISLDYANEIALDYDHNFFTIGFSALSYFHSEQNKYAYQLVGFNKEWVPVETNPIATFTNVPPGHYVLRIRGSNHAGVWSQVRSLNLIVHPPFWQTWWFRTLALALLIMMVVVVYRFQLERQTLKSKLEAEEARRRQKEAELNEKEASFQAKLAQTEMAALRSQMNPHFIFNCLNSIQYFTAQNDVEKASDYLTRFSRLIRLVLENSKSDKVTLSHELEMLRLYIEMEAMRFPQKLHYLIQLNDSIDADWVQIPPLLLQPFVENAIWHGLMHKDEGGTVWIRIEQPQEHLLHVEITDNGIGRAKAAEYKSKSATQKKSFGLKITAERIAVIQQLYHIQTELQIIDLVDEQGQVMGTTIFIDIPI